jgi:hypothetical protein
LELISACGYSFHDLSRVQRTSGAPRFNMPFEVGLTVATARWRPAHQWFLFEAKPFRVQQTLSDLSGTDAYIHGEGSRRLLIALTDALVRATKQPTVDELGRIHRFLRDKSSGIRRNYGTLFGARAFRAPTARALPPDTRSFVVAIDDQIGAPAAWQVHDPAVLTARR